MDADADQISTELMENNFECPSCGKQFYIQKYKLVFSPSGMKYKTIDNKEIICSDLSHEISSLRHLEKEGKYSTVMGSSKAEGKKKLVRYLKKRSKDHFKKDIAPIKSALIRQSTPNQ